MGEVGSGSSGCAKSSMIFNEFWEKTTLFPTPEILRYSSGVHMPIINNCQVGTPFAEKNRPFSESTNSMHF